MSDITWRMGPDVLALSFLCITPGYTGSSDETFSQTETQTKAIAETIVLGTIAACVTKSWWPIVLPALYLGYNHGYHMIRNRQSPVLEAN